MVIMAVMLITSNILQVAAVNMINRYVMLLGKDVVLVSCLIAGYLWLTYSPEFTGENALFALLPSIAVICFFAFAVSTYVFAIYNVGVDTILLCFCQDCMIHENIGDATQNCSTKACKTRSRRSRTQTRWKRNNANMLPSRLKLSSPRISTKDGE